MLLFGCIECCAATVVGFRLPSFEPFKQRINSSSHFVLGSYPAPSPKPNPYFARIYVLSSKLDLVIFPKPFPTAPKIQLLFFFIVLCRTRHILRISSLHYLLPAVVRATNARSWAWPISQDTQIMSPSTANK